jgi:hypothetical protein
MIKELEDYNWFPKIFRRFQMEYIGSIIKWVHFYQPMVPVLKILLKENNTNTIHDLCSGSGLPAVYFQEQMGDRYKTILTDKFPESSFINTVTVNYLQKESDVMELLPERGRCYTMYNAFHHFNHQQQKHIIQKLQTANAPFVFAEILEPDISTLIKIIFTTTILQLLTVPFVRPFSLLRLLFTYIIPVNLFTVTYDGVVSVLKSKSVKQYQKLLQEMINDSYELSAHRYSSWKGAVIYLKGNPKK